MLGSIYKAKSLPVIHSRFHFGAVHFGFSCGKKSPFLCYSAIDIIEPQQTENKIRESIGKEKLDAFQNILLRRFLPCSPLQLFSQIITTELVKRFLTRDLETDQQVFRLFLNRFHP